MRRLLPGFLVTALLLPGAAFAATDAATDAAPTTDDLIAQDGDTTTEGVLTEDLVEDAEEAEPFELPVDLSLSVSTSATLGSLTRNNYGTRDSVASNWGFGLGYDITDRLSTSLSAGFNWCMNKNCGIVRPGEVRFSDMGVDLSYSNFYEIPRAGINMSAGIGAVIPTSRISRAQNLYTAISPSLSLSRGFGPFSLSYGFGFSKNFNKYRVVAQDARGGFERDIIIREGGAEAIGTNFAEQSGYLGEWSVSHSLGAGLRLKNVSLSLGWSFGDAWTYRTDLNAPDSLDGVTIDDPGGRDRRGHSQFMSGSIGLGYTLPVWEDRISLSTRMSTSQPPKTSDNRRVRFPFFDTQSANLSYTSLSLGLSIRY